MGCQIAPVVSFVPEMAIFDLPMVFAQYDGETIDQVLNGDSQTHAAMSAAYEKVGLELLGIQQYATYRLTTANRELRKTLAGLQKPSDPHHGEQQPHGLLDCHRRRPHPSGLG